ncbi:MAG: hypothetical protein ABEH77_08950 [Halobacteriaceae archaeon]
MQTLETGTPFGEPPAWATAQRALLDEMAAAIDPVMEYVREDGSLLWPPEEDHVGVDALDDAYESFYNWPLVYLLGGDRRFYEVARAEFDAITEQFAGYDTPFGHPMVVDEYEQGYDWFHQGEGYLLFYLLGMADPADRRIRELAERFAGFYLPGGEVGLYDAGERLLKSPMVGSMGPAPRNFSTESSLPLNPWAYEHWGTDLNLPFYDVEGIDTIRDVDDEETAARLGRVLEERWAEGDVVGNLAATTLVANAYLHTGDEEYREWVTEYVGAWLDRAAENGGIAPDNVGPAGDVGGAVGDWYGGFYGWTWPHGWHNVGHALAIGAQNAAHLDGGDTSYLSAFRSTLDALVERGIERDGTLQVPYKRADPGAQPDYDTEKRVLTDEEGNILVRDGWFEFIPLEDIEPPTHVWFTSLAAEDRERLRRLRDHQRGDHERVLPNRRKWLGGHEYPWLAYLDGDFPGYPEEILELNREQVRERVAFMREDDQDPATYSDAYLQERNPVSTEGLVQTTMGAPQIMYYGGLQVATVRHFDPERHEPGLPPGVAALVTGVGEAGATLELVNTADEGRRVLVQAGAFGEHRFTTATTGGEPTEVGDRTVEFAVPARARATADLGMERFAGEPRYAFPWDR